MRAVLIVLGIAIAAILLSLVVNDRKDLTPLPQDREQARRDATNASTTAATPTASGESVDFKPPKEGAVQAVMTVEGKGDVTIEMYPKAAPKTVEQIAGLIKKGFYNGIKIHRVEPGFVVQAGDPDTKTQGIDGPTIGQGGSGNNIPFETNDLKHVKGTVAMALSAARSDTADSQLFINLAYNASLDGDYCVFGKVTEGMDVVEKIQRGDTIKSFVVK